MTYRKEALAKNKTYHIMNKSIAGFKIFNSGIDYRRMLDEIVFYSIENPPYKFSEFKSLKEKEFNLFEFFHKNYSKRLIEIIAYCLMPTHIHLILKELKKNGISKFMNLILNSYSHYFNKKHNRKGPLWQSRFKNILVENDNYFKHLTRYIHVNPIVADLAHKPADWGYSSYREYLGLCKKNEKLCNFSDYLDMDIQSYKNFTDDQIGYKRALQSIKHLILE